MLTRSVVIADPCTALCSSHLGHMYLGYDHYSEHTVQTWACD